MNNCCNCKAFEGVGRSYSTSEHSAVQILKMGRCVDNVDARQGYDMAGGGGARKGG